jgi:hypothetical protein
MSSKSTLSAFGLGGVHTPSNNNKFEIFSCSFVYWVNITSSSHASISISFLSRLLFYVLVSILRHMLWIIKAWALL